MGTKSSRHLVDPALLPLLDSVPPFVLSDELLPAFRTAQMSVPKNDATVGQVLVTRHSVRGMNGAPNVAIMVFRPVDSNAALGCLLHIHGGGFISGTAGSLESVYETMSLDLQCCIVAADYRLAPETPFPGALEDCYATLAWIIANADTLGVSIKRVGVMGESAGGGLAAALALLARDRGEYSLAFQHLIYPMLDDRTCVSTNPHPYAGKFIWTPHSNAFGWSALLGTQPGSPDISPYASPARAQDLSCLPPCFVAVGSLDLFLEEDLEYARRLTRSGVPVELHVYPGAFHAFNASQTAEVAISARADSRRALVRSLGGDAQSSDDG